MTQFRLVSELSQRLSLLMSGSGKVFDQGKGALGEIHQLKVRDLNSFVPQMAKISPGLSQSSPHGACISPIMIPWPILKACPCSDLLGLPVLILLAVFQKPLLRIWWPPSRHEDLPPLLGVLGPYTFDLSSAGMGHGSIPYSLPTPGYRRAGN